MAKCIYCGKEITTKSHHKGGVRKYCNMDCYNAMHQRHEYGMAVCLYCGKEFQETRDRPNKFCSPSCSTLYQHMIKRMEKAEENEINPETQALIEEAEEQIKILTERLKALYKIAEHQRRCRYCGRWFTSERGATFCSEECRRKADNYRRDHRITRNGKADYTISLPRLYARDGGVCQICGEHLSFEVHYNDPKYPSIDHIIPLSKGGLHRWDNVQLLCRECNMLKRDTYTPPFDEINE